MGDQSSSSNSSSSSCGAHNGLASSSAHRATEIEYCMIHHAGLFLQEPFCIAKSSKHYFLAKRFGTMGEAFTSTKLCATFALCKKTIWIDACAMSLRTLASLERRAEQGLNMKEGEGKNPQDIDWVSGPACKGQGGLGQTHTHTPKLEHKHRNKAASAYSQTKAETPAQS